MQEKLATGFCTREPPFTPQEYQRLYNIFFAELKKNGNNTRLALTTIAHKEIIETGVVGHFQREIFKRKACKIMYKAKNAIRKLNKKKECPVIKRTSAGMSCISINPEMIKKCLK